MMKENDVAVWPEQSRQPFWVGGEDEATAVFSFACPSCGQSVSQNIWPFVRTCRRSFKSDDPDYPHVQAMLELSQRQPNMTGIGLKHCPGPQYFGRIACQQCGTHLLVCVALDEFCNGGWKAWLHAAIKIAPNQSLEDIAANRAESSG